MTKLRHDPLADLSNVLLRHPEFERVARLYIGNIVQWRRSLGLINRVITDASIHIVYFLVMLHFCRAGQDAKDGATFTNLLEICEARGHCGSRALRTVLAALTVTRYVHARQAEDDQRIKVFAPSQTVLTDIRRHLSLTLGCLDILIGEERYAKRMLDDPSFLAQLMASAGESYLELGLTVSEQVPELHGLLQLRGGHIAAAALANAHLQGDAIPSPQAIARVFHVSASQIRNVLAEANTMGLITSDPGQGATDVRPLVEQMRAVLARELALYAKYGLGLEEELCARW
jgi:Bacterial regulatory proteins, gntR family